MLQHCVALKIVVANRLVKHHLNAVDLFCLNLNHIVNSRREKKIDIRCVGEWCQISLALLLVNCHIWNFLQVNLTPNRYEKVP